MPADLGHQVYEFSSDGKLFLTLGKAGGGRGEEFLWLQFSRPSGIYVDKYDVIYVADSESGSAAPVRKEWKRGIRIGSANDGIVTAFIPDPNDAATDTSSTEGEAVDSRGNIHGAEVGPRAWQRYVRR